MADFYVGNAVHNLDYLHPEEDQPDGIAAVLAYAERFGMVDGEYYAVDVEDVVKVAVTSDVRRTAELADA